MAPERPLIGVNLLYIRPGYVGGTVRYAHELLMHLCQLERYRLVIYVQEGVIHEDDPALSSIPRREFRVVGGLAGRVFVEHIVLPFVAHRDGVDLLFSPGFVSPLWGRFRKVVTIHDLYYRLFPQFVRPWQRRYWQIFLPLSLWRVDAAIAVSNSTCKDICVAYPWATKKTKCIHLGADALNPDCSLEANRGIPPFEKEEARGDLTVAASSNIAKPPSPPPFQRGKQVACPNGLFGLNKPLAFSTNSDTRPYCIVVGNITPNKNIETVLTAFGLLKNLGVDCRLVIAGSDLFGLMGQGLKVLSIPVDFELLERVDDNALAALYANAVCLIQASHYEGFGLPVIEAMNTGCPVIASDIPVLREVGGNAAMYFSSQSADDLAKAVRILLEDEASRSRLIVLGHDNASRFKWRGTAMQTAELFDQVLGVS